VRPTSAPKWTLDDSGCWLWISPLTNGGYGLGYFRGRMMVAHRAVYLKQVGPIPYGLQLDHLCRVRRCVNPEHLEAVTPAENSRRALPFRSKQPRQHKWSPIPRSLKVSKPKPSVGRGFGWQRTKTHCPKGHPYDVANTYRIRTGGRNCRSCAREWQRVHYPEIKAREASL
jgi:hypothetical protein